MVAENPKLFKHGTVRMLCCFVILLSFVAITKSLYCCHSNTSWRPTPSVHHHCCLTHSSADHSYVKDIKD